MVKIDNKPLVTPFGKSVSMHACPRRRCQFCTHTRFLKEYTIVPGLGHFALVGECGSVAIIAQAFTTSCWHQQDIPIITATRTTEMRMGETIDHRIRVMIPATTIPSFKARIWTQLYHTEGNERPRVCMPMPSRADHWVYP